MKTMLGLDDEKVICKIRSSNNTVSRRMEKMTLDISSLFNFLQTFKRFDKKIYESTDVDVKLQLMVYVIFSNGTKMVQQLIFSMKLIKTKEDNFKVRHNTFSKRVSVEMIHDCVHGLS